MAKIILLCRARQAKAEVLVCLSQEPGSLQMLTMCLPRQLPLCAQLILASD